VINAGTDSADTKRPAVVNVSGNIYEHVEDCLRRWDRAENPKESVDNVVLPHEDSAEQVRNDD